MRRVSLLGKFRISNCFFFCCHRNEGRLTENVPSVLDVVVQRILVFSRDVIYDVDVGRL